MLDSRLPDWLMESLGEETYEELMNSPSPRQCLDAMAGAKLPLNHLQQSLQSFEKLVLTKEQRKEYVQGMNDALVDINEDFIGETVARMHARRSLAENAPDRLERGLGIPLGIKYFFPRYGLDLIIDGGLQAAAAERYTRMFARELLPRIADEGIPVEDRLNYANELKADAETIALASIWKATQVLYYDGIFKESVERNSRASAALEQANLCTENLTPDVAIDSSPLSFFIGLPEPISTYIKISGLLAIGTNEAKLASLLLGAIYQLKKPDPTAASSDWTASECYVKWHEWMEELGKLWILNMKDLADIIEWLESGARWINVPAIVKGYVELGLNNYKRIADCFVSFLITLRADSEQLKKCEEFAKLGPNLGE